MSKLLDHANAIGADFILIVKGDKPYNKFYKKGNWQDSRNCMLYYNAEYNRWDNSSELSFSNIERGMAYTNREYSIVDVKKGERIK